jgi:hypothetical protein
LRHRSHTVAQPLKEFIELQTIQRERRIIGRAYLGQFGMIVALHTHTPQDELLGVKASLNVVSQAHDILVSIGFPIRNEYKKRTKV